jgi:guanylate kinase
MGGTKSGKSTVEKALSSLGFKASVSYTTRGINTAGHKGEINGVDYNFVTKEQFKQLISKNMLIEYTEVYGNYYGTPKFYGSTRYVAVVELEGYRAIKNLYKGQVLGVLLTADKATVEERSKICSDDFKNSDEKRKRLEKDEAMVAEMEKEADLIIDSTIGVNQITIEILKEVQKRRVN